MVGGFVLALAADPLTSGLGREGLLECRTSSVPPKRLRLSLTEDTSEIKIEEGDARGCWLVERLGDAWKASLIGVSFRRRVSVSRVPRRQSRRCPWDSRRSTGKCRGNSDRLHAEKK